MKLYFEEYGNPEQTTLVFIHGLATSSWVWWEQIEHFDNYHIILIDLPGHGGSQDVPWISLKDTFHQIKHQIIRDKSVHMIGASLGGHVTLDFAKYYPENLLSAYISGITVKPMKGKWLMPLIKQYYIHMLNQEKTLQKMIKDYNIPPEKHADFKDNAQKLSTNSVSKIGLEIMSFNFDLTYEHILTPIKIVCGEKETDTIKQSLSVIPQTIPSASSEIIPNAEHQWPIQQSPLFNQKIKEWLEIHS